MSLNNDVISKILSFRYLESFSGMEFTSPYKASDQSFPGSIYSTKGQLHMLITALAKEGLSFSKFDTVEKDKDCTEFSYKYTGSDSSSHFRSTVQLLLVSDKAEKVFRKLIDDLNFTPLKTKYFPPHTIFSDQLITNNSSTNPLEHASDKDVIHFDQDKMERLENHLIGWDSVNNNGHNKIKQLLIDRSGWGKYGITPEDIEIAPGITKYKIMNDNRKITLYELDTVTWGKLKKDGFESLISFQRGEYILRTASIPTNQDDDININ